MSTPHIGVSALLPRDGGRIEVPDPGVLVIVGPNNAGKSRLVGEILSGLFGQLLQRTDAVWLSEILLATPSSDAEVADWFSAESVPSPPHRDSIPHGTPILRQPNSEDWNSILTQDRFLREYQAGPPALGSHVGHLVQSLDWGNRSRSLNAPRRQFRGPRSQILHQLWDDPEKEKRLSAAVKRAFGFPVCIDRYAENLSLLIGEPTVGELPLIPEPGVLERFEGMPSLDSQGDGVKCFVGMLMNVLFGPSTLVIDEPEAFLHPPQARLIGKLMSEQAAMSCTQYIVATHSEHFLQGVLSGSDGAPVKVVRVSETVSGGRAMVDVEPAVLRDLWRDPLLRYSNLVVGMFGRGQVICEGDSDCRFYESVIDAKVAADREHDLVFSHVQGKDRQPSALGKMRRLGIPAVVISDFDVLNETSRVRALVDAAGGDYGRIAEDLERILVEASERDAAPKCGPIRELTRSWAQRPPASPLSEEDVTNVRERLKGRRGWGELKRAGTLALEGEVHESALRILEYLRTLGIFVVPVGDLERWFPEVSVGKQEYVREVLRLELFRSPSDKLSEFVGGILEFLNPAAVNAELADVDTDGA